MKHGFQTQTGYAKCDPVPHPSQPLPTPPDLPASLLVKGFWLLTNCNKQPQNWDSDQWEQIKENGLKASLFRFWKEQFVSVAF